MNLNKDRFSQLIRGFQFRELFNELGWDNVKKKELILLDEDKFELDAVGEKRNFVIFLCSFDKNGKIPNQNIRRKIDNKISKLYFEHLIIYTDSTKSQQIWQLVIREPNKPIIPREFVYYSTQYPEILLQKLSSLFFSIDEEEKISLPDVKARIQSQFNNNAEKVTKKFYERFQKELTSFQKFIEGIEDKIDKEWYASLMLNRLMFVYFIQKKGFLDNNNNYLHDKLKLTQKAKGKDKFYSFYKDFLLVLFHDGLGSPKRTKQLEQDLGKIPYLNGGLFEVHQLEEKNKKINIEDKAFEKIFSFFDEYNWHLDNRPTSSGKDINPDVIGYIFEKYINDRAAMGAYYTKEDITEYISKNTIIPFLFDEVKKECANAFREESSLWKMLRENPDRYIYDAVKHGIYEEVIASPEGTKQSKIRSLPPEIQKGINPKIAHQLVKDVENNPPQLLELRKEWNKPAPEEFALPTEIWREVVERRSRYFDIKSKIESGEIKEINDFITYSLDIRQFAQDAVEQYEGSDFINAFYKTITKISILDPTCGSGAFLFAALNILEPLYEACINRMRGFIEDDDKHAGKKHTVFRNVLEKIEHHPNEKYYIYKSIILKNLYGVDIMKEAIEIAKLRLFLKLVAEVDVDYKKKNLGLEPLPDIDFNIKCGNTLVGYTSYKDIEEVYERKESDGRMMFGDEKKVLKKIEDEANIVADLYNEFKEKQAINDDDSAALHKTKKEVNKRLAQLNDLLNKYLAFEYHIDSDDLVEQSKYKKWLLSHKPFHWFAEFYEIMNSGGFDVIIGNPPYLEMRQINYDIIDYESKDTNAIHAICVERSINLLRKLGNISMIIPLALVSTQRMKIIQEMLEKNRSTWYSNYAWRPAKLFDTVNRALTIFVSNKTIDKKTYSTNYQKWISHNRNILFPSINYMSTSLNREYYWCPKLSFNFENDILKKLLNSEKNIQGYMANTDYSVYYRTTGGLYWKIFTNFPPKFYMNGKEGHSTRETNFSVKSKEISFALIGLLSSNLFWWWYTISSNLRDLNPSDIYNFKFHKSILEEKKVITLGKYYLKDLINNSYMQDREQKNTGSTTTQLFVVNKSKNIIDEIDKVLAEYYGFTEEELDFIINYDIKYRMGKELEEE